MKKYLSLKFSTNMALLIYSVMALFHLLIIAKVIPYKYTWGGKLDSYESAVFMESISLIILLIVVVLTLVKVNHLQIKSLKYVAKIAIWLFVLLFALNTIGNLLAEQSLETYLATPVTFLLTILNLRIAIS